MQSLVDNIKLHLQKCAVSYPILTFAALESFDGERTDLENVALSAIRSNDKVLTPSAVNLLQASTLKRILEGLFIAKESTNHHRAFDLIHTWAGNDQQSDQHAKAKQLLSKCVDLKQISSDILSTRVERSGLASRDQLFEAYKHKALVAMNEDSVELKWKNCDSRLFSPSLFNRIGIVDCKPMACGTYHWSLEFKEVDFVMVGIVDCSVSLDLGSDFTVQRGTWACFRQTTWLDRKRGHNDQLPTITGDAKVAMTLNLNADEAEDGSLSISVNGGPMIVVTNGLSRYRDAGARFLPAVAMWACEDKSKANRVNIVKMRTLFGTHPSP
ncbi:expressed unknown protein [Seminavis robusta]|uniref:Uncharacterized protein n=1 Tax=Seminavis robusta TaxID=568900 RepID=A0A9N8H4I6_9STRA|nr:expressed unknown protein [Seminavis robusta]|eukprot:Sro115_g056760.1 n/a (327) ;mRNA; r:49266-50246